MADVPIGAEVLHIYATGLWRPPHDLPDENMAAVVTSVEHMGPACHRCMLISRNLQDRKGAPLELP